MFVGADEAEKVGRLRGLLAAADSAKQTGFYTDFDPDTGSWSSPGSVTEAEFAEIGVLVGDYVTETQRQFDEFTRGRAAAGQARARS